VQLREVRLSDPEVRPLLEGLTDEYTRRYGETGEMTSVDAQAFEPPDGIFVVLLEHGTTVAGGGLRRLEGDVCEVKRMWTAPDRRRRGLASAVLDALEVAARNRGYSRLRLETGPAQPEARSLYERRGYRVIPPYGIYAQATAFELLLNAQGEPQHRVRSLDQ
jgi:GNAT superfamily N-acetyltransferase